MLKWKTEIFCKPPLRCYSDFMFIRVSWFWRFQLASSSTTKNCDAPSNLQDGSSHRHSYNANTMSLILFLLGRMVLIEDTPTTRIVQRSVFVKTWAGEIIKRLECKPQLEWTRTGNNTEAWQQGCSRIVFSQSQIFVWKIILCRTSCSGEFLLLRDFTWHVSNNLRMASPMNSPCLVCELTMLYT